jgi:hypothetical protein
MVGHFYLKQLFKTITSFYNTFTVALPALGQRGTCLLLWNQDTSDALDP